LFLVEDEIRKMILKGSDASQLRDQARKNGMRTLLEDGVDKVRAGMTTFNEVLRVTQEV
jgi:type II secretory ATPase GspE/PulE/Tfp pilus assembly ATPase PilB-like protein